MPCPRRFSAEANWLRVGIMLLFCHRVKPALENRRVRWRPSSARGDRQDTRRRDRTQGDPYGGRNAPPAQWQIKRNLAGPAAGEDQTGQARPCPRLCEHLPAGRLNRGDHLHRAPAMARPPPRVPPNRENAHGSDYPTGARGGQLVYDVMAVAIQPPAQNSLHLSLQPRHRYPGRNRL